MATPVNRHDLYAAIKAVLAGTPADYNHHPSISRRITGKQKNAPSYT